MASGAGLNRASLVALTVNNTSVTSVSSPLTAYGTAAQDTGTVPLLVEARDFTKWTFSRIGGGTGYAFSIYGTVDPMAYKLWKYQFNPNLFLGQNAPTLPASSWFLLDAPSAASGTGSVGNPLTDSAPLLQYSGALVGVRVVLTTAGSAGACSVVVEVAP